MPNSCKLGHIFPISPLTIPSSRRQNVDDERRRRLMAEFDRSDFMDAAGDFKVSFHYNNIFHFHF